MPVPVRIKHLTNPKDDIWDDVSKLLKDFKPLGARVLVVVYERGKNKSGQESRTQHGIIIPDTGSLSVPGNDKWQGKVGLVIAMGPLAFKDDTSHAWGDVRPQVNDWVMFDVGNTSPFDLPGGRRARYVDDVYIDAVLPDSAFDAVW
jgi:co-chaperonin GroES (HSP10)